MKKSAAYRGESCLEAAVPGSQGCKTGGTAAVPPVLHPCFGAKSDTAGMADKRIASPYTGIQLCFLYTSIPFP